MKKATLLFFISTIITFQTISQELLRRASFEAEISWPDNKTPGAAIKSIQPNTPFEKAGFLVGDLIVKVNGIPVIGQDDWSHILYSLRAETSTIIDIKRKQQGIRKAVMLNRLAKENNHNVATHYESVMSDYGIKQRVIVTIPQGDTHKKHPAIFLVQGLSCSSVEKYSSRSNNWVKLIKDLAEKSNMVLFRVEKPGVGDSEGNCGETDFATELNGYETALLALKSKAYIDTNRIVIYGNSMGSALAPYLANKYKLAGIISDGTFFKSWYEHMLEIERRILGIEGKSQAEIYELMNTVYIPLYYEMLIKKRDFHEILQENPRYKEFHRQGLNHMYGRPMRYYHQVQDFNFAKYWENIRVPVRIRWGTNDWIMSEVDNNMIIKTLERTGHKNHKLFKYEGLDHWSTIHLDYLSSYNFRPGNWEDKISQQIIDWAWEIVKE